MVQTSTQKLRFLAVFAAFAVPAAVLWYLYFIAGNGGTTAMIVVALLTLASAAAGVMAGWRLLGDVNELEWKVAGMRKTRHVLEYAPDGTILYMNQNILEMLGYQASQCIGRNHSMFVTPEHARSPEYREFWQRLARGEYIEQRYQRKAAGGRDIWVLSNYTPVYDHGGKLIKIVNWLTDLTAIHQEQAVVVDAVAGGLKKLSEGDLTARIDLTLEGKYDEIRVNFNAALGRLQDTLKAALRDAGSISSSASEITTAADDLSRRTEQQAASLEQTAAALEEITATVKKTASNAKEARNSVTAAKGAAESGGRIVESAVHAMDSIAHSSHQITDIIGVIDEIAFQTNLLALNAGVEAARAGDAGKGFAVVASEVRALAQRSSEAAKQIKALIKTSGEHVDTGVRLVGESGAALKHIVEQVVQINSLVSEMAQAAEQQSSGIEQVNAAVGQMDQVTQQNAAMVEQSTAASRQMAGEAQSLAGLVSFFRVGNDVAAVRAPARIAAKPASKPVAKRVVNGARPAAVNPAQDDWTEF
jgi:methyl-accepting chemotaxis protein